MENKGPQEGEQVTFRALESWEYPQLRQYQYDYMSDSCIQHTLDTEDLSNVQLQENWAKRIWCKPRGVMLILQYESTPRSFY